MRFDTATYCVPLECFDGSVLAETTHMNALVSRARREAGVILPVDVQGRR